MANNETLTAQEKQKLFATLWNVANDLRGAMTADNFRDYMLSLLFMRYLSENYEKEAKKILGSDFPTYIFKPSLYISHFSFLFFGFSLAHFVNT